MQGKHWPRAVRTTFRSSRGRGPERTRRIYSFSGRFAESLAAYTEALESRRALRDQRRRSSGAAQSGLRRGRPGSGRRSTDILRGGAVALGRLGNRRASRDAHCSRATSTSRLAKTSARSAGIARPAHWRSRWAILIRSGQDSGRTGRGTPRLGETQPDQLLPAERRSIPDGEIYERRGYGALVARRLPLVARPADESSR